MFRNNTLDNYQEKHSKIPPGGLTYNASEYRAWLCGPALASWVNQLPNNGRRSLFAHSMGNVIAGSALRAGMNINHYALCNAAVSAMCYDSSSLLHDANIWHGVNIGDRSTPDNHQRQTVREYGLKNKFNYNNVRMNNFTLSKDSALDGWITNNKLFKPNIGATLYYSYDTDVSWPLIRSMVTVPPLAIRQPVRSLPEAMGYVTKSLTPPTGRTPFTRGAIDSTVSMDAWFGDVHSAQWRKNYLESREFWFTLIDRLVLTNIK